MLLDIQSCKSQSEVSKLDEQHIHDYLALIGSEWQLDVKKVKITRHFKFKNFKQTMFFVNAVAYLCEKEGHHPDMNVSFGCCEITLTTHDVHGLSINDFICAAKISNL